MEVCMEKQYSTCNSGILQPFNKKHVLLNRPHRAEAIDTLTIDIAIASNLHHQAENLSVRNRYHWTQGGFGRTDGGTKFAKQLQ